MHVVTAIQAVNACTLTFQTPIYTRILMLIDVHVQVRAISQVVGGYRGPEVRYFNQMRERERERAKLVDEPAVSCAR